MAEFILNIPVVLIIFNRPNNTMRVFDEIRKAKPSKLFVIADGPREDKEGEALKCQKTREIIDTVDWKCEVFKNYSDVNLGCKVRIAGGLDWVFEHAEEAIVFEDDCVPHQSFFPYCQELLDRYRLDKRVMMISGTNPFSGKYRRKESYFFSEFSITYGWATWKRVWDLYDMDMKDWPANRNDYKMSKHMDGGENERVIAEYFGNAFQATYDGSVDTWDYQMVYSIFKNKGLHITPRNNLITNIGFGPDSAHTTGSNNDLANLNVYAMRFPLVHPDHVCPNKKYGHRLVWLLLGFHSRMHRILSNAAPVWLYRLLRALYRLHRRSAK